MLSQAGYRDHRWTPLRLKERRRRSCVTIDIYCWRWKGEPRCVFFEAAKRGKTFREDCHHASRKNKNTTVHNGSHCLNLDLTRIKTLLYRPQFCSATDHLWKFRFSKLSEKFKRHRGCVFARGLPHSKACQPAVCGVTMNTSGTLFLSKTHGPTRTGPHVGLFGATSLRCSCVLRLSGPLRWLHQRQQFFPSTYVQSQYC